jgi:ABC-2 type transport system ATP-binding protein
MTALVSTGRASGQDRGTAVRVEGVSKRFRLYKERNQTLKAAMMRGGRSVYEDFWALRDVSFEIPTRRRLRADRARTLGQVDAAQCMARS